MERYPGGSTRKAQLAQQAEQAELADQRAQYFLVSCLVGAFGLLIAAGTLAACIMMSGGNLGRVNLPLLAVAAVVALGCGTYTFYRFAQYYGEGK